MTHPATIIMTGATGYIGRHLLVHLLQAGHRIIAIVRRRNGQLEQRLAGLLAPFDKGWTGEIEIVEGDVSRSLCGIEKTTLEQIKKENGLALLHSAGLTAFDSRLAPETRKHNLDGTINAFDLCRELDIPEFHHLSTAFVAGNCATEWREEDLDHDQGFRNPYEKSKFEAECHLHGMQAENAVRVAIYRPSIVVGGQAVGEAKSTSTVYTFLKTLHFVRECCLRDMTTGRQRFASLGVSLQGDDVYIPMRVAADPKATINLVSIEQVVDTIVRRIGQLTAPLRTLHIIGQDFSLKEVRRHFCAGMAVKGPRYVPASAFDTLPRNPLEERFHRATRVYEPYMHCAPKFSPGEAVTGRHHPVTLPTLVSAFRKQMAGEHGGQHPPDLGSMALSCLGVTSAQDYFARLIGEDFGFDFLQHWDRFNVCIRFTVTGTNPFDRSIRFEHGKADYAANEEAVCRYRMDEETFHRITFNQLDPKQAFFKGLVTIDGDMETGLKFAVFLSNYLQSVDEHVITELSGFRASGT